MYRATPSMTAIVVQLLVDLLFQIHGRVMRVEGWRFRRSDQNWVLGGLKLGWN